MARTITETRTVYKFSELSEKAQQRAVEKRQEVNSERFHIDAVYDDFIGIAKLLGINFKEYTVRTVGGKTYQKPMIYYSGFSSQGDGASFFGSYAYPKGRDKAVNLAIREYAGQDTELHRIADTLETYQKSYGYHLTADIEQSRYGGNYVHSGTMSVECDLDLEDRIWELEHITTPGNGELLGSFDDDALKAYTEMGFYAGEAKELIQLREWRDSEEPLPWEEVQRLLRDLADWLYKRLDEEYDFQTSEEVAREDLIEKEDEVEYNEDGTPEEDF